MGNIINDNSIKITHTFCEIIVDFVFDIQVTLN